MTKNYIGIDVSAKTLEISRLVSGEPKRETIKNDGESIQSWIATFEPATFCVFEATGVYSRNLEYWLSFNKVAFSKVTPTKIKGFMKANGVLQKTDRHDAVVIRQFGEKMQPEPSRPIGEVEIEKARLEHSLAALQKQFQMIDNQIHVLDRRADRRAPRQIGQIQIGP
jgi:transposase